MCNGIFSLCRGVFCLLIGLAAISAAGLPARSGATEPGTAVIDLRRSVPVLAAERFSLRLMEAQAGVPSRQGLSLTWDAGVDGPGELRLPGEGSPKVAIVGRRVALDGDRLVVDFTLRAEGEGGSEDGPRSARLEATLGDRVPALADGRQPDWLAGGFWTVRAMVPAAYRPIEGRLTLLADQPVTHQVVGTCSERADAGQWTSGRWDEGVRFGFDMGTERQNWNFARLATLRFDQPRDFSAHRGLELKIRSLRPRDDAGVTLWLREADSGWYYIKDAVALVDRENRARLYFEDFGEAEWVAPGNHMDADYTLDLTKISEMAIGVVNPLGVGPVEFVLEEMVLFGRAADPAAEAPAKLGVTGNTLSVNRHNVVPAAIFGGYAPDLPQEFRPGTQRYLHPSTTPRMPGKRHAQFSEEDVTGSAAIIERLVDGDEGAPAVIVHLKGLMDARTLRTLDRMRENDRAGQRGRRAVRDWLNRLLLNRDLYQADQFRALEMEDAFRTELSKIGRGEMTSIQMMMLHRKLLETVFDGRLRPVTGPLPTEMYFIDCLGERKEPAYMLTNPNWEQWFADWGQRFAENVKASGERMSFQFWNEPYLNWAERSRVNYQNRFFDVDSAGEGRPVQIRYRDGTLGPVVPHFAWRQGDNGWEVYDPTAFSYWSGRGNGWLYDQMLGAIAPSMKQTHPEIILIAGWGFRWHEDHWAAWDMLYKPTIDRHIQWIDALDEHHYQGDTTAMNGSYEVATAYAMTAHQKWLYSANTETNDLVDSPARGAITTPEAARQAREYRRMVYNVRDLVYSIKESPDKLLTRTVIHITHTPEAARVGYGLLTNLRGRLIETRSDDPNVWVVASVDGTDPDALPAGQAEGGPQSLVVVVFNDHRRPRSAQIRIEAPEGTRFGRGAIEQTTVDLSTFQIDLDEQKNVRVRSDHAEFDLQLDSRMAWKITLPLEGSIVENDQVVRRQYFSPDILKMVRRDQPLETTVKLPLEGATAAYLRLVVEQVHEGEALVEVGGQSIILPRAVTADNGNRIVEIPLDLDGLSEEQSLRFSVRDGNYAGYRVCMASVVLETRSASGE